MKTAIWLSALLVTGCANAKPVQAAETLEALKGRPLTTVTYMPTDFGAITRGKMAFGMFGLVGGLAGAAAAEADGNTIVRENDIPDPAIRIAEKLTEILSERLQPSATVKITGRPSKLDSVAILARDAGSEQIVLDVQTTNWAFMYMSFSSVYRAFYQGRARVIDARSAKPVAQASCSYKSDDKTAPTYDEMLANKAERLKIMLAAAADSCAESMARELQ